MGHGGPGEVRRAPRWILHPGPVCHHHVRRDWPYYLQECASGGSGECIRRNLDLGILIIDTKQTFTQGETVNSVSYDGNPGSAVAAATGFEYNAPYYYIDGSKKRVDIDPAVGPGALLTPVTYADYYIEQNNDLKVINVIRPDVINEVVNTYFQALGTSV